MHLTTFQSVVRSCYRLFKTPAIFLQCACLQAWSLLPASSLPACQPALQLTQEASCASIQYPAPSSAHNMSQAARCRSSAAHGTLAGHEQHLTLTCPSIAASAARHPFRSGSKVSIASHSTAQTTRQQQSRCVSSTSTASERMSEDKADLDVGTAAAAAAQTMQQQPSAHGLQAAPQIAKVLGFAGARSWALPTAANPPADVAVMSPGCCGCLHAGHSLQLPFDRVALLLTYWEEETLCCKSHQLPKTGVAELSGCGCRGDSLPCTVSAHCAEPAPAAS